MGRGEEAARIRGRKETQRAKVDYETDGTGIPDKELFDHQIKEEYLRRDFKVQESMKRRIKSRLMTELRNESIQSDSLSYQCLLQ